MFQAVNAQVVKELEVLVKDTTFHSVLLYDVSGRKVLQTEYYLTGNNWVRSSQIEWFYTPSPKQVERKWRSNKWVTTYTIDYVYSNNQLITETHNGVNGLQQSKIEYQYSVPNNTLLYRFHYLWEKGVWSLKRKDSFLGYIYQMPSTTQIDTYHSDTIQSQYLSLVKYNTKGLPDNQCFKSRNAGDADWKNQDSTNWYYHSDQKRLLSMRSKIWDTYNFVWVNSHRTDYDYYDSVQVSYQTNYKWNGATWQSDLQYANNFAPNGNKQSCKVNTRLFNEWRPMGTILYSDYAFGMATKIRSQFEYWGGTPNELVATDIPFLLNNEMVVLKAKTIDLKFAQQVVDTTTNIDTIQKPVTVYPNPSNGVFYIGSALGAFDSWQITNLDGKVVKVQSDFSGTMVIDITDLPAGVYLLTAYFRNMRYFQKLIKI